MALTSFKKLTYYINLPPLRFCNLKCGCNQIIKQIMEQFLQNVNIFMRETKLADFMNVWRGKGEVLPGFREGRGDLVDVSRFQPPSLSNHEQRHPK